MRRNKKSTAIPRTYAPLKASGADRAGRASRGGNHVLCRGNSVP